MFDVSIANTLEYFPEKCVNCDMCIAVCPHEVFAPGDRVVILARPEACMECGACAVNCPTDAIELESGVGCASALIWQAIKGGDEPACCGGEEKKVSCCC